jgi:hypothetical protein
MVEAVGQEAAAIPLFSANGVRDRSEHARIVAANSQKVIIAITTTTTTMAATCLTKIKTDPCRRKKRNTRLLNFEDDNNSFDK